MPNSSVQAAAPDAFEVTVTAMGVGAAVPVYVHVAVVGPDEGFALVYATPVTEEACAGVSSEQTSTADELTAEPLGAVVVAPPVEPLG